MTSASLARVQARITFYASFHDLNRIRTKKLSCIGGSMRSAGDSRKRLPSARGHRQETWVAVPVTAESKLVTAGAVAAFDRAMTSRVSSG